MSQGDTELNAELASLMRDAWPDGVPPEEAAIARTLAPDRLVLARQRLKSVLAVERGGSIHSEASELGIDRVAFFRLRQRWRQRRSLRSLVPFIGRAPRRVGVGRESLAGVALQLVREAGVSSEPGDLVDRLLEVADDATTRQTGVRLLREAASQLSAGLEQISESLGSEVLVDFSGTAMNARTPGGSAMVVVCLVVETASRLILGWSADTVARSGRMMAVAISRAVEGIVSPGDPSTSAGRLKIVVPETAAGFEAAVFIQYALSQGATVIDRGERRFGRELARLVGHRLGRLSLHPRAYTVGRAPVHGMSPGSRLAIEDAASLVAEAVRDHNRKRNSALLRTIASEDERLARELADEIAGLDPLSGFQLIIRATPSWRCGGDRLVATMVEASSLLPGLAAAIKISNLDD